MIDHRSVAVALAIVGGAGSLGFVTVGDPFSHAATAREARLAVPNTTGLTDASGRSIALQDLSIAAAKADRLSMPAQLSTVASLSEAEPGSSIHPVVLSVSIEAGEDNSSVVSPTLSFASFDTTSHLTEPFDKLLGATPTIAATPISLHSPDIASPPPVETPEIAEEEEDAQPSATPSPSGPMPLPPAKPLVAPSLPLPKFKPAIDVDASIGAGRIIPVKPGTQTATPAPQQEAPGAIPIRQPPKPNSILAFFTPPAETTPPASQGPMSKPPISTPNGTIVTPTPFGIPYVLQTQSVDTACLRPELLQILRSIESHYGQKVVITSGYRNRGRPGSLHRTCSAADIIVPGVSSQALATYSRTISGIGGVGTYCNGSMIHVDVGTPRDWKYGCGSYFAMRDGSAHWGKQPQME